MKIFSYVFLLIAALMFWGCRAVYAVNRADADNDGTIVFSRPAKFHPFFGSRSLSEFIEVTYEKFSRNEIGQPVVEVGIRYRGPVKFSDWFSKAPNSVAIKVRTNFLEGVNVSSPIIWSTEDREIVIPLGQTYAYRAVCPVVKVQGYRVILGDYR